MENNEINLIHINCEARDDRYGPPYKWINNNFWEIFFSLEHEKRSERHISKIKNGSAGKRLNFFLRWMVRNDNVDFGIWKNIDPANLYIPLDVHVGNISRELGIITRKQNDWKSVVEITSHLRLLDSKDPIKYDLALFSLDL